MKEINWQQRGAVEENMIQVSYTLGISMKSIIKGKFCTNKLQKETVLRKTLKINLRRFWEYNIGEALIVKRKVKLF